MDLGDLESLIEYATVDCYNDEECRIGFLTVLRDNIPTPFKAKLGNTNVIVKKIGGGSREIKAFIQNSKITCSVDILNLKIEQNVQGYQWVTAYRKWETGKFFD